MWFIRERNDLVVYSKPTATRMANLASNRRIAFNLRADPQGDTVVTIEGTVAVDLTVPPPSQNGPYRAKYAAEIARLFGSEAAYDAEFSTPLRITVNRVRHWG